MLAVAFCFASWDRRGDSLRAQGGQNTRVFPHGEAHGHGCGDYSRMRAREHRLRQGKEVCKMGAGRPKKYTKKGLEKAVEEYFSSISRDADGEVWAAEYKRPPTVSGLCLYLGIDRSTWQNYADRELHPEFQEITAYAKMRMEAYLEEQLLTREKNVQGLIFNLQNNYGWREKREVELGGESRKAVSAGAQAQSMSIAEKVALLAEQREALAEAERDDPAEDVTKPVFGFAGRPGDAAEQ